ncbi:MAG: acyltransferase family protein [Pseudomonadales bacterium]|uniref:Phospholipid/glycerol acyltransferase n=1 Tax=Oleiphilus messinensis TaxID=141451 RepID=A0A1Y0I9R0_9GAMM|nr:lysophospholipid acyltransferase family protein [Oleiphilus messinensis]ARU56215.1 phospholipid/glycerol acyltransferase [Oleiphilus messinensis]MCG8611497.1 acyltransferase family protein [Pseudomonadales bacterium]
MGIKSYLTRKLVSPEFEAHMSKVNKPVGTLGYDPWGYNTETSKIVMSLFQHVYNTYFRVQATGLENIPAEGPVLIIGNHSGQLPIDGMLVAYSIASRQEKPRMPRAMIERFFPTVPLLGNFLNQLGAVLGDPVNCSKMLKNGEAVIVFPEGIRGSGKLYKDRYQLQRFGNGFLHLAMQNNATIIPVGIVGCEETIPAIANIKPLAKMLGVPYVPVALPVIFPAKVHLNFGKPMTYPNDNATEDEVTGRVEEVKTVIRELIDKGLQERKGIF